MIGALPTLRGVMLIGLVVALPITAWTVGDARPSADDLPVLLIAGLGNVIGLGSEYIAVRTGKVGVVGALAAAEGAIAAILSVLAGENLAAVEAVGVAVVGLGVVLAALGPDPDATDRRTTIRAIAFGSSSLARLRRQPVCDGSHRSRSGCRLGHPAGTSRGAWR